MNKDPDYLLGHNDSELDRLKLQAEIIAPITRRLIRECGIGPGMNVLEIGCGAGDVSMLLAESVGHNGRVVAIDRAEQAVATGRQRAAEKGYRNITFVLASDETFSSGRNYDAAFGRYVLIHQSDPVAMLRRAAAEVKSGGIVAFHELTLDARMNFRAFPDALLFQAVCDASAHAFRASVLSPDIGSRLPACFEDAGLREPSVIWELIVGDCRSPILRWVYFNYLAVRPTVEKLGLNADPGGDPQTLLQRMFNEVRALRGQIISRPQVGVWATVE